MKRIASLTAFVLVHVLVHVLGSTAFAQPEEFAAFERARVAYDQDHYEDAVTGFEALLGGETPALTSRPLILESRKYLGASYVFLGRPAEAMEQFEQLLHLEPAYQMDPEVMPNSVLELWAVVQARVAQDARQRADQLRQQELERANARQAQVQRQQEMLQLLRRLAEETTVEHENSRMVASLPFGLGQFQNQNPGLGWTLAIGEGALTIASITTAVIRAMALDQAHAGNEAALSLVHRLRLANWTTSGVLAVAVLVGIVDAHLRFRPFIRGTRHRELPPELREGLHLVLTPAGVGFRF